MIYIDLDDSELVSLLRKDDVLAYNEIYQRYKWVLFLHVLRKIRDREQAKDIVQELFVTLWDKRQELFIKGHLSGYLYTAVRNRVIKFISHQQVESNYLSSLAHSIDQGICITDHLARENNLAEIIEKAISELPEKMQEVFVLSRKQNLNHKEIAEQLGIEESTVKRQVSNALKILRGKLGWLIWLVFLIRY